MIKFLDASSSDIAVRGGNRIYFRFYSFKKKEKIDDVRKIVGVVLRTTFR